MKFKDSFQRSETKGVGKRQDPVLLLRPCSLSLLSQFLKLLGTGKKADLQAQIKVIGLEEWKTLTKYTIHKDKAVPSLEVLWIDNGDGQTTLRRQVTADQEVTTWAGKSQVKVYYGFGRTA